MQGRTCFGLSVDVNACLYQQSDPRGAGEKGGGRKCRHKVRRAIKAAEVTTGVKHYAGGRAFIKTACVKMFIKEKTIW